MFPPQIKDVHLSSYLQTMYLYTLLVGYFAFRYVGYLFFRVRTVYYSIWCLPQEDFVPSWPEGATFTSIAYYYGATCTSTRARCPHGNIHTWTKCVKKGNGGALVRVPFILTLFSATLSLITAFLFTLCPFDISFTNCCLILSCSEVTWVCDLLPIWLQCSV